MSGWVTRRVHAAAVLVLGGAWLAVGLGKLFDPKRDMALRGVVGESLAQPLATILCWLEVALGASMLLVPSRLTRRLGLVSLLMLACFGAWALLQQPVRCRCAGRLADLAPLPHTLLIAGMLMVTGIVATPPPESGLRFRTMSRVAGAVFLAVVAGVCLWVWLPGTPGPTSFQAEIHRASVQRGPVLESPVLQGRSTAPGEPAPRGVPHEVAWPRAVGTVVTEGRRAVPNARVWGAHTDRAWGDLEALSAGTTDANGRFDVATEPATTHLCVQAPGVRSLCLLLSSLPTDEGGVVVQVPTKGTIRGEVTDSRGLPVAGALVQARGRLGEDVGWSSPWTAFGPRALPEFAEAATDGDGKFEFYGLGDSVYTVVAAKAGYTQSSWGEPLPSVRADTEAFVKLVVHALHGVHVRVVDDATGDVLAHALVELSHVVGQPWTPAGDVLDGRRRAWGSVQGPDPEESLQTFFHAPGGDALAPVRVFVHALGFRSQSLDLVPASVSMIPLTTVRMAREGPVLSPITLRLRFGETAGPTGGFQLELRPKGGKLLRLPMKFVDGVSVRPLALPPGSYRVSLAMGSGSFMTWRRPMGKRLVEFDVTGPDPGTVDLPVFGAGVLLSPRLGDAIAARQFWLSASTASASLAIETWTTSPELERRRVGDVEGVLLWLDPGDVALSVTKVGYGLAERTMSIGSSGVIAVWAPDLPPR